MRDNEGPDQPSRTRSDQDRLLHSWPFTTSVDYFITYWQMVT